jgi:hypothetical protein
MIGWLLRATFTTVVLSALAYVVIAVPVGRRTLLEHGTAIANTEPARELVDDVADVVEDAVGKAKQRLTSSAPQRAPE